MHAHCGILREHVLRVADACFGHRLMMDRVVPGGVAADLATAGAAGPAGPGPHHPPPLPRAGRALRQHRLAAGPHRHHRHSDSGAGAPVRRRRLRRPRLGARLRCAQDAGLCALHRLAHSRCRCARRATSTRACGCASTRSSSRLALIEQILDRLPAGRRSRADPARRTARGGEGLALVEGFRGDVLAWVRLGPGRHDRALPPARSVLVPVAAAGGGHRGQHRRRLPALQQVLQLLLLGPRSVESADAQAAVREPAAVAR